MKKDIYIKDNFLSFISKQEIALIFVLFILISPEINAQLFRHVQTLAPPVDGANITATPLSNTVMDMNGTLRSINSNGQNGFSGDDLFYYWDQSLNNGLGGWVFEGTAAITFKSQGDMSSSSFKGDFYVGSGADASIDRWYLYKWNGSDFETLISSGVHTGSEAHDHEFFIPGVDTLYWLYGTDGEFPMNLHRVAPNPLPVTQSLWQSNGNRFFQIGNAWYLATGISPGRVVKWNGTNFTTGTNYISSPPNGCRHYAHMEVGGEHYLAIHRDSGVEMFKWNGSSFVREVSADGDAPAAFGGWVGAGRDLHIADFDGTFFMYGFNGAIVQWDPINKQWDQDSNYPNWQINGTPIGGLEGAHRAEYNSFEKNGNYYVSFIGGGNNLYTFLFCPARVSKEVTAVETINSTEVTYELEFENITNNFPLVNVQITDDLNAAFPGATNISVLSVSNPTGGLSINNNYDGIGNNNLLSGTDNIPIGALRRIVLVVDVQGLNPGQVYNNTAEFSGTYNGNPFNCSSGDSFTTPVPPAAYYDFEDGPGSSIVTDLTNNQNDLTLIGANPNLAWNGCSGTYESGNDWSLHLTGTEQASNTNVTGAGNANHFGFWFKTAVAFPINTNSTGAIKAIIDNTTSIVDESGAFIGSETGYFSGDNIVLTRDQDKRTAWNAGTITADTWHRIDFVWNIGTNRYEAYMDGLVLPYATRTSPGPEAPLLPVNDLILKGNASCDFQIDNFEIRNTPITKADHDARWANRTLQCASGILYSDVLGTIPYGASLVNTVFSSSYGARTLSDGSFSIRTNPTNSGEVFSLIPGFSTGLRGLTLVKDDGSSNCLQGVNLYANTLTLNALSGGTFNTYPDINNFAICPDNNNFCINTSFAGYMILFGVNLWIEPNTTYIPENNFGIEVEWGNTNDIVLTVDGTLVSDGTFSLGTGDFTIRGNAPSIDFFHLHKGGGATQNLFFPSTGSVTTTTANFNTSSLTLQSDTPGTQANFLINDVPGSTIGGGVKVKDMLQPIPPGTSINLLHSSSSTGSNNGNDLGGNTNWFVPGITVSPTSGLTTTESGGQATFTVVLDSRPNANVTIGLSSTDTSEGTVSPSSLTFTPGNSLTPQTVTITGVDDCSDDGNIAYTIVTALASSGDSQYNGLNASDVSVTNTDNNSIGITVDPTTGLSTTEAGGQATFTVVLNSCPTANVTIGLSSNDLTEGTVSPSSITFTNGNWNIAQTVTVKGVDDCVGDGNLAYAIITAPASSSDGNYNNLNANDVSVTNNDNERPDGNFEVTNTNDSGPGSLRQAIICANAVSGVHTIFFSISALDPNFVDPDGIADNGDEYFNIALLSPLPAITETLTIDGLSQDKPYQASCGSSLVTSYGSGPKPQNILILLNASAFNSQPFYISSTSTNVTSTMKGIILANWTSGGIPGTGNIGTNITGNNSSLILDCVFFGVDAN